ncbi:unnamed protein product, partial [Brenthis ino]
MCEQTEINYLDGDVVWVKLGSCWWPGEVVGSEKLPPDVLPSFRKPPIAVVKFFQEDTYEYVKNLNCIYKYNCSRKNEFINKGLYMYRTKHGHMEKFPEDVIRAETAVGGDIKILTRDEFQETKKESYAGLFGDPSKKTPTSGRGGRGRPPDSSKFSTPNQKFKEKTNYKVHILLQGSKTPTQAESVSTPSTSRAGSEPSEIPEKQENKSEETEKSETNTQQATFNTPTMSSAGIYACHACNFTTTRLNVLILHNKTHSVTFTPYTPSPVRKKTSKSLKSTPVTTKTPKQKKPRQEKSDKPKKTPSIKRTADPESNIEVKKQKTDEEIKSSLLADWDDGDEESNDDSAMVMAGSPEVPIAAESPAVPTPAELPSAQVPVESVKQVEEQPEPEKPESSSDSKYEFCEDEDWPVEADIGRKIPRVKNPSKRKGETKSVSIDEDEIAREVAELLNKTTLPELPAAPEPLKVEENFPERSIVKSPDKKSDIQDQNPVEKKSSNEPQPSKTIFKTKTFFRSRHSRSQDAIGKYVAEQLNAAERMDIADTEINGSDTPIPEIRVSPPREHVKVARLAPKVQFKKMKAEAAQLRELEKINAGKLKEEQDSTYSISPEKLYSDITDNTIEKQNIQNFSIENIAQNENREDNNKDVTIKSSKTCNKQSIDENINKENNINNNDTDNKKTLSTDEVSTKLENNTASKLKENEPPKTYESYMNETTASAVDALLSVSRETDRVTKNISDDPPEDLFEDDIKDNTLNSLNGFNNTDNQSNGLDESAERISKTNQLEEDDLNIVKDINNEAKSQNIDTASNLTQGKDVIVEEINEGNPLQKDSSEESSIQNLESSENNKSEISLKETKEAFSIDSMPSESDLQIAEALINLPTTTMQNKVVIALHADSDTLKTSEDTTDYIKDNIFKDKNENTTLPDATNSINTGHSDVHIEANNENINSRFETEQEKSENLNAAQSLVQMSESIDLKIKIPDIDLPNKEVLNVAAKENDLKIKSIELKTQPTVKTNEFVSDLINHHKVGEIETNSPKLLKILEEPVLPKLTAKKTITKQIIVPGKEKILNFDVGKSPIKSKSQSPKQKIIVRRTAPNKNLLNRLTDVTTPDKIILSRTNKPGQDGSSVQTYTIQTSPEPVSDANTIIIQQKIRKITKPVTKLQKIKPQPQTSLVTETKTIRDTKNKDDNIFDINSMPIVISDDILTPESIEKMPIVMSDGNVITNSSNPPKLVKTKSTLIESEKMPISATPNKTEIKTLLMNSNNEINKVTTPNILSKSSKLRGAKPMLVIDKTTGKQKIIMTKTEPTVKEIKQTPTLIQSVPQSTAKTEKFIILPTPSSPRPGRTQKIVIDPQTGKAHVLVGKAPDTPISVADNKPVSAKLIPSASDASTPGNTVMIITNAQGAQSRIVLTPEHEKILFPNKQQPNISQLKNLTHRITANSGAVQKTIVSTAVATKTQTRIVPKQKSAIITSKGQLIVGNRISTTTQNIAPLPEIRPAPKRILATEPKKLVQTIQKSSNEPLIFLQQKSGTVMQLTAAQFEHLQRTGQIIQKAPAQQEKIIVQKSVTLSSNESVVPTIQKQRIRKQASETPMPPKRIKHEIAIAPAPTPVSMPALAPISNTIAPPQVPNVSSTTNNATVSNYSDMDNFEELLPSTAIARQEPVLAQPELPTQPTTPASLSDGQLLAVPGEHFGGPAGSFYLCVEENGTFTVIDNRPLVLENNQLVPMPEPMPVLAPVPERRDILEAALANSDVFHAETARDEAPDFRDLNANVSVHCRVSETSTTLNQPIMTPVEVPSKGDSEPTVPSNLEDGLAVIGVTPHTVPTSLELPITVTDPRIAPKTTNPLSNNNYGTSLLPSPNTEMTFTTTEDISVGPISMPLLTEEESVGKSMPILTDEVNERTVSSVESTIGSPSSIDVRESENEDSGQWPRRLLTPCSDTSETSAEIPLQPIMQLSVNDLSHSS